jgi:hypothetical protein
MHRCRNWIAAIIIACTAGGCGGSDGLTDPVDPGSITPLKDGPKVLQPGHAPTEHKTKKGYMTIP